MLAFWDKQCILFYFLTLTFFCVVISVSLDLYLKERFEVWSWQSILIFWDVRSRGH